MVGSERQRRGVLRPKEKLFLASALSGVRNAASDMAHEVGEAFRSEEEMRI